MTKVNIISPPDKIYSDSFTILIVYPNPNVQSELQKWLLSLENFSANVYFYNENSFNEENAKWLLDVFNISDITIIDIDNVPSHSNINQLLSYMIAKPKTYWLTNYQYLVYNLLSNNRVYDLSFLSSIGVSNDKKQ